MELAEFIEQALEDYRRRVYAIVNPLTPEELSWRPSVDTNSIGFLLWHVARVEDRWIQLFAQGKDEVWIRGGWYDRLGLPKGDTGVNYTAGQVAAFPEIARELLQAYFDAVREESLVYIRRLKAADFDDVPDGTPFPEFPATVKYFEGCTVGRMFRQLIGEEDQHLGHVAFIRGLKRGLGN